CLFILFSTDPPPTATSPLSLHDALPILNSLLSTFCICLGKPMRRWMRRHIHETASSVATTCITTYPCKPDVGDVSRYTAAAATRSEEHTSELQSRENLVCRLLLEKKKNK